MSTDAATPWYRSAAEMSAAGIDLYPVTDRVAAKVADRSSGVARPAAQREAILADPGFGRYFTDHMVRVDWAADTGWGEPELVDYAPLPIDPDSMFIHYGQSIFEGLKAYRHPDGSLNAFRPEANAARFARSARRLAMAELPEDLFLGSVEALVRADAAWVSEDPEKSLYLRPFEFATEIGLGVRPANAYTYLLVASPGRRVLPPRREAGQRLAVDGVRPGGPRRHRGGQVLGQLRRVPDRPGARRRAGMRPGRLARCGRAALGRGDGRDEPGLRLRHGRLRPPRDPCADRHPAPGRHPRLAAEARRATWASRRRRAGSRSRTGRPATPAARSPRCSPAGRPRSSPRSGRSSPPTARVDGRRRPARSRHHEAAPRPARHPDRPHDDPFGWIHRIS